MSKCLIISAIDHVNRRTKTVVKGDATSSTLTSFTTKQEAMTANGSQHSYGHRGARWELFISTSVPGVCVGGKLDRVCRWLLTKPPSALVTCGADQQRETRRQRQCDAPLKLSGALPVRMCLVDVPGTGERPMRCISETWWVLPQE